MAREAWSVGTSRAALSNVSTGWSRGPWLSLPLLSVPTYYLLLCLILWHISKYHVTIWTDGCLLSRDTCLLVGSEVILQRCRQYHPPTESSEILNPIQRLPLANWTTLHIIYRRPNGLHGLLFVSRWCIGTLGSRVKGILSMCSVIFCTENRGHRKPTAYWKNGYESVHE